MAKYRKKPIVIDAVQWHPGVEIEGTTKRPPLIVFSRDRTLFYLDARFPLDAGQGPFRMPDAWLRVEGSEKDVLPFAFWEVKSGDRIEANSPEGEPLARRYLEYAGVKELPSPDVFVETLEGKMLVSPGDWIITGVKGERYPCKPDIFEQTYDSVSE